MPFTLNDVVPWGRSFAEYRQMFALSDAAVGVRIVGCGDGPASFNAEATRNGLRVVSVDPLYQFSRNQIDERVAQTYHTVLDQARMNAHEFVWSAIRSVDELGDVRMAAMRTFLADWPAGCAQGRYVAGALPALPFSDRSFDLALCSHFLFLYSEQLTDAFHLAAIREMCRVASEVRIFPLLELGGRPSRHVPAVVDRLRRDGLEVTIETVPYEFQRGGNQMLRIQLPTPND